MEPTKQIWQLTKSTEMLQKKQCQNIDLLPGNFAHSFPKAVHSCPAVTDTS